MSFRYILRYLIDPHFDADQRVEELTSFCVRSRIEEVMLFITAEELSAGHPTSQELQDYAQLGKSLKKRLDAKGVALSLNPWSTIYHNFRGRKLHPGQNFRQMVGETGMKNHVAACPLCENWQSYLCESFAMLVREIQPVTLWVEDDWRLRNHDVSLGWGGCFCEEHLQRFSAQIGQAITREEVLKAILAPGPVHPWRKEWFTLSCETLRAPLERLSRAIRTASPNTRLALMSSSPDAHSSEGRQWHRFQEAVGNIPTFISRPNMAPYSQGPALNWPPSLTRLTIANLNGPLEIYPELESSPRCGPYSKSKRYTTWQMMNCAFVGSDGVTINHYDMMGNGLALDPTFGEELRRAKDGLNGFASECSDDRTADGVEILFSPDVSQSLQPEESRSIANLMQESYLWGDTCGILGIAHRYTSVVKEGSAPILVSGQTLRALDQESLHRLFRRSVILDADAVMTALDLGFGSWIGLRQAEWKSLPESAYAYEEILMDDPNIYGVRHPRMTAQRCSPKILRMEPTESAEPLSTICQGDHTSLWPGAVQFSNERGGTVVSLTYPVARQGQFFMGFFNVFRRIFLQRLFFSLAPQAALAMASLHPLHCYRSSAPNRLQIAVTNPMDDPVEEIAIDLPVGEATPADWQKLDSSGQYSQITPTLETTALYDRYRFPVRLDYLDGVLLLRSGPSQL